MNKGSLNTPSQTISNKIRKQPIQSDNQPKQDKKIKQTNNPVELYKKASIKPYNPYGKRQEKKNNKKKKKRKI